MEFDPDNHQTQPVIERKRFSLPGLSKLPLNKSVLTAILAFGALAVWLVTGVMSDNSRTVEAAKPLIEGNQSAISVSA